MKKAALRSLWCAVGLVTMTGGLLGAEELIPLTQFTGSWFGRTSMKAEGTCTLPTDAEGAAALDVVVKSNGSIEIKEVGLPFGKGRVAPSGAITGKAREGHARCGAKSRTYERAFSGQFRKANDTSLLELVVIEAPCPPECRFEKRYRLRKLALEPWPEQ